MSDTTDRATTDRATNERAAAQAPPAIDVKGLTVRYPNQIRPAVASIDVRVDDGEILGFLGPSGAGKTTTQRVLIGRLRGYEGQARILGREVGDWGVGLYERIGVSFELPSAYRKLTARENLELFAAMYRGPTREPAELLDRLGLSDAADRRAGEFSKGMAMRLNLARALLHDPRILFLDEPTTGMDPVNAQKVIQLIREVRDAGTTVFLTTHDMHVADALCDRVAFIAEGRIAAEAPPREFKLQHGTRRVRIEVRSGTGVERVDIPLDRLGDDPRFLAALESGIETVHSQEATLDDVFRAVTGRRLGQP